MGQVRSYLMGSILLFQMLLELLSKGKNVEHLKLSIKCASHIAIWYDHATIGNRSYVLFTFQFKYKKAT